MDVAAAPASVFRVPLAVDDPLGREDLRYRGDHPAVEDVGMAFGVEYEACHTSSSSWSALMTELA